MLVCNATLRSISPISFGAPIITEMKTGEGHVAFAERTWQEKIHVDEKGRVFMPPSAIKICLETAAQSFVKMSIPGEKGATYSKRFKAGLLSLQPIIFFTGDRPATVADCRPLKLFVPSDGKRGSGSRVWRFFPTLDSWQAQITLHVVDLKITEKVLETHLREAGKFVGMGSIRAEGGGVHGRFEVVEFACGDE